MIFHDITLLHLAETQRLALEKWIGECSSNWKSKIAALNLYYIFAFQPMPSEDIKYTITAFANHLAESVPLYDPLAIAKMFLDNECRINPGFLWSANLVEPTVRDLSRVKSCRALHEDLRRVKGMFSESAPSFNKTRAEKLMRDIYDEIGKERSALRFTGYLDVVWLTPTSDLISAVGSDEDNPAVAARAKDVLGLNHLANEYLVEVRFMHDIENPVRKPNVMHSGFYEYFISSDDSMKWNMTLDLATMKTGLREGIRKGSPWPDHSYRILGFAETSESMRKDDDNYWDRHIIREIDRLKSKMSEVTSRCDLEAYVSLAGIK